MEKNSMYWMAVIGLIFIVVLPLAIGIYWAFWQLYLWIIPQLWPTAPIGVLKPDFITFAAVVVFIKWLFHRSSSSSKSA